MARIVNLMGAASVGRSLWDAFLLKRLLSEIAVIGILSAIAGLMIGALLLASCYALMLLLIHYGLNGDIALIVVGGLMTVIAAASVLMVISRIRRLRESLHPIASQVSDVAGAFMDGLRGK